MGFRGQRDTHIIKLRDHNKIEEARALLRSKSSAGVMGEILKSRASYNPRWSYHLKPSSIKFFELAIEVCDASPKYIEKHLNKVGSDFLPGKIWCPWSSYVRKEIRRQRRR
ncbi:MAG: calmodulin [SAR324 cluster bacterium]|uniref:Calmodulin n=1 Tax=SAR324 cluster bacterium TaxID=2024889 RepID=A0A7X9FPK6_9DELT|nr:calmodulin [SAR324 cluster bacterium]